MSEFRLPRIPRGVPLVDSLGAPLVKFQQWWQSVIEKIEAQEATQDEIIADLQTAQDTADATPFFALTAGRANTATTAAKVDNALTIGSGLSGTSYDGSAAVTITNTAPDQTVTLTSGTGISATGTYPDFTVTNTAPDQTVTLTSGGGCTITGTYPNFTISVP